MLIKNYSNNNQLVFTLAQKSSLSIFFYKVLSIITLGIFNLLIYWKPKLQEKFFNKINEIVIAQNVIITSNNIWSIRKLKIQENQIFPHSQKTIFYTFKFKKTNYYFDYHQQKFLQFPTLLEEFKNNNKLIDQYQNGMNEQQIYDIQNFIGLNLIKVKIPSHFKVLIKEIISPFYFYQTCCIIIWFLDEYAYYSYAIIFLSLLSLISTLIEVRQAKENIQKIAYQDILVKVKRINKQGILQINLISSINLIPGDIIEIYPDMILPCDILLTQGECIVNEGMLTGESIPIKKNFYETNQQIKQSNILLAGTQCMMCKGNLKNNAEGIIVSTGFDTFKGSLIKKILLQEIEEFRFHKDAYNYLFMTFIVTTFGVIWYFYFIITNKIDQTLFSTFIKGFELYTTSVPPILPLCLTLGLQQGITQLKQKNIQTLLMGKINQAGRLKIMCFDKTGTLTENELIFNGFLSVKNEKFTNLIKEIDPNNKEYDFMTIFEILAGGHNLTIFQKHPVGDPLEVKMFEQSFCKLEEIIENNKTKKIIKPNQYYQTKLKQIYQLNEDDDIQYEIIKNFEFTSERKKSSSIIYNKQTQQYKLIIKGVPQIIAQDSKKQTIPKKFNQKLEYYSKQGLRIIAIGSKIITQQDLNKNENELEQNIDFQGFILFKNPLKPLTLPTLQKLREAKVKNIMITGDSILTALNVAYNSQIIPMNKNAYIGKLNEDGNIEWNYIESQELRNLKNKDQQIRKQSQNIIEIFQLENDIQYQRYNLSNEIVDNLKYNNTILALSGDCFQKIFQNFLLEQNDVQKLILNYIKVYARTNPNQKAFIVQCLKKIMEKQHDEFIGFCGDGANDCSALQVAHVGLSLSEMDASIASPFVSTIDNISTVLDLMIVGKACLQSGIQSFKYISTSSLYEFFDFSNGNYYLIDIFTMFPLTILISTFTVREKLTDKFPHSNIFNFEMIFSIFGHLIIVFILNLIAVFYYINQPTFVSANLFISTHHDQSDRYFTVEVFGLSGICSLGCLFAALFFTKGKPFKYEWWQNKYFIIFLIFNFICQIIFLYTHNWFKGIFQKFVIYHKDIYISLHVFLLLNFI